MLNSKQSTIAIVDSGIGGVNILKQLISKFKFGNYIYFADNFYMPYGNKSKSNITKRIDKIINLLNNEYNVELIIIACNTASTCVDEGKYKNVITMSFNENETFLATPLTKKNLNDKYNVIADKRLAKLIESNIFEPNKLDAIIKRHVHLNNLNSLKSLTLGCTHFESTYDLFKKYCKETEIKCNSVGLIKRIDYKPINRELNIVILQSKNSKSYYEKILKLLNLIKPTIFSY